MSIHRFAARRDANEPEIRKRFAYHGWHTEQVSGAGMPDLMCWPAHPGVTHRQTVKTASMLVDVKDGNGKPTKAQVSKWRHLRLHGIPVYVVRTEADVDALVAGTLEPWGPAPRMPQTIPAILREEWEAIGQRRVPNHSTTSKRSPKASYTPPRSTPVDAAKEAEAFAPDFCHAPQCNNYRPCPRHQLLTPKVCGNTYPCRCALQHTWDA